MVHKAFVDDSVLQIHPARFPLPQSFRGKIQSRLRFFPSLAVSPIAREESPPGARREGPNVWTCP